jgi:hypothetical protein
MRAKPVRTSSALAPAALDRINHVNIVLMLGSAALACVLPFEVFLVSYALLGPLHYLTQISWLHDRGYFTTGSWDWVPLGALALLALDTAFLGWLGWPLVAFAALVLGSAAAFVRSGALKLAALAGAAALAWPLSRWDPALLWLGSFLPTVIHVFVFTGLFVLAGTLKARSRSGLLSFAVFLACGIGLLVVQPATDYEPSAWALQNLGAFSGTIDGLARLVPGEGRHPALMAIGRFLAFAYTYHYLNWFSKTEVIRWHRVPRARLVTIAALWLASVALYLVDYATGLAALFFLSTAHVFLEFPLDARTAAELFGSARRAPT